MTRNAISHTELEQLVVEYHHLQPEHRRGSTDGAARRHVQAHLDQIKHQFEQALIHGVGDESEREKWRQHLVHGTPAPASPGPTRPALLFKGLSETGCTAEVREHADGGHDIFIDGSLIERVVWRNDDTRSLRIGAVQYRETFGASPAALAALRAYIASPQNGPPWQYATELIADGLIDRDFSLVARGRRATAPAVRQTGRDDHGR